MSVVYTADKWLCDACRVEYIGPPSLFENRQREDMKRTVIIAVNDQYHNRLIGRKLNLCPACSDAVLDLLEKMEPPKQKKKWRRV